MKLSIIVHIDGSSSDTLQQDVEWPMCPRVDDTLVLDYPGSGSVDGLRARVFSVSHWLGLNPNEPGAVDVHCEVVGALDDLHKRLAACGWKE